ncbi:MAG: MFS transporter [Immundisolibacterales bacterium]|nr:MFS transporter [Immundisolibacterales bacterium]
MSEASAGARRKLTLAACCATHSVQDGLTASIYILLPILAQAFGLSFAQVGLVRAAHSGAMGLLELPAGVLSERLGQRRLLAFGLLCAGTGYVTVSMSGGFTGLLIGLCIAGSGAAFQHALSSSLVSATFSGPDRRTALGAYNSSGDAGKLLFTGLLTTLLGAGAAWPQVAAGYGSLAIAAGIVLFLLLRTLRVGGPAAVAERRSPLGGADWGIRNRRGFATLAAIVLLDLAVQDAFLVFIAFLMVAKQVPVGLAGFAVVLTLAGGIAGKFGCGLLAARVGPVRALVAVEIVSAAAILAVLAAPAMVALCLLPLAGLVLQGSSSITYGTVGDLVDERRQSRGFALVYTLSSVASIVGPVGFGLVSDRFGLEAAMLVMAFVVVLPAPLALLLRGPLRQVRLSQASTA